MLKIKKGNQKHILQRAALAAIFPVILAGCGGSGGIMAGGGGAGPLIAGAAVKGPVSGATVTVYILNADGTYGAVVGTGTTDASGKFSFHLSSTPTGPVAIVISGGSYISESTGTPVTGTSSMCAMAANLSSGATGLSITPLSDMVCARARTLAGTGSALGTAIGTADTFVMGIYGLTAPPEGITPSFTFGALGTDPGKLALVLAGLDKLRSDYVTSGVLTGSGSDDLYGALSKDIADGTFDGMSGSTSIPLGAGSLPFTAGSTDFVGSLSTVPDSEFAGTPPGGLTGHDSDVTGGIGAVSPPSVGLEATSSGAMSTLAYGGHQYLYVAARTKGVEKIDITNPAAPKVLGAADGWGGAVTGAGSLTSHFTSGSIGGAQIIAGLTGGPQLLVLSYGEKHIALVDPKTGAVNWEGNLTLTNGIVYFSGGSAYIAGAIPVLGKGAWLSTSDGYQFFDANATLAAGAASPPVITTTYPVATGQQLAENLGGDIQHGLIFSPNYRGLQVINLTVKPEFPTIGSYTLDPSFAPPGSGALSNMDGGTMDSHLKVGVITYEDTNNASFIDMKKVIPGTAANTFLPAATNGYADVKFSTGFLQFSGSAVDPATDQALFMAGYSNDLAVGQIQDPATVAAGATWKGLNDWVYYTLGGPGSFAYSYAVDPHAAATVNISGKSYGYILNGSTTPTGVVQIDMKALLAMPRLGATGDPAHQTATAPTAVGGPISNIALP